MILETERLILREMNLDDLDNLFKVLSDPETMKFYPKPCDRSTTKLWIERNMQRYIQQGIGLWGVILKENNQLIGDCGLVRQKIDDVTEVEIGYHVRRDLWGQGLATEAAQACLNYGFKQLSCDKLIGLIRPGNIASRRVAEKNGMRLIKEIQWHNQPTSVYAIERNNFLAKST
jgi:RimJ/RimL family protein N-acetyltransferase